MTDALAAAQAVAREHGVACDEAVALAAGSNVLVHLKPAPVVARVMTGTAVLHDDVEPWLAREVGVGAFLGDLVVPPTDLLPPGPHERDGLWMTLRRLGGVRARVHARGTTSGGTRRATARTRALLEREHFTTPAGAWLPERAKLTARGRSFLRSLRGKLIAVASLRCDGHDANVRGTTVPTSRLSLARAAVMCHALGQIGVRSRPRLAGHGDSEPIASNATARGRAKNRRVEVTITHRPRRR